MDFIADRHFLQKDFRLQRLAKADYDNCVFENCQFQGGFLDNQHFVECTFTNCDMTNTNIANSQFNDVTFNGCKMVGIDFETCDTLLLTLAFNDCNLSLASFQAIDITGTSFENCVLHQVDFSETVLKKCTFGHCDFQNATFVRTDLSYTNLVSSFHFTIDPTQNTLKKARFNESGLIGLLKKYDIVVE